MGWRDRLEGLAKEVKAENRPEPRTTRPAPPQPNALARGLITQRSGIVGIVISDFGNPFLSAAVERLSKRLGQIGLQPLLIAVDTEADVRAALSTLEQYRVDGCFVFSPHMPRKLARRYHSMGTTVLMFNPQMTGLEASFVSVDNVAAGRSVADFLLDEGHGLLGYVHGPRGAGTDRDRYAGFVARLEERGGGQHAVGWGDYSYHGGAAAMKALAAESPRPTAVFFASDIMAMGAMDIARNDLDLAVPEDISIIGFDDAPPASWPSYQLTTIRQPLDAMIEAGIAIVLDSGDDRAGKPAQMILASELVIRSSTRPPSNGH